MAYRAAVVAEEGDQLPDQGFQGQAASRGGGGGGGWASRNRARPAPVTQPRNTGDSDSPNTVQTLGIELILKAAESCVDPGLLKTWAGAQLQNAAVHNQRVA